MKAPTHLMNVLATITRTSAAEAPDADGVPVIATTTTATSIAVFPAGPSEDIDLANIQTEVRRIFLPAGLDVKGPDRIMFGGDTWSLVGNARPWQHPRTGVELYAEAHVTKVE